MSELMGKDAEVALLATTAIGGFLMVAGGLLDGVASIAIGLIMVFGAVVVAGSTAARQYMPMAAAVVAGLVLGGLFVALVSSPVAVAILPASIAAGVPRSSDQRLRMISLIVSLMVFMALLVVARQ